MQRTCFARSLQGDSHRAAVETLVVSADDLDHVARGEGIHRRDGGFGNRRDGIVEIADAVGFVDEFETMGETFKLTNRVLCGIPRDAEDFRAVAKGHLGVELVVFARHR